MQGLYSTVDYAMGKAEQALPITASEKAKAEREIKRMRRSLKAWLKYRKINDEAAMGRHKARVPAHVIAQTLPKARDWALEQRLAVQLHTLLSEVADSSQLPNPDISKNPNAAVELAKIAISGSLPAEASSPEAQGFIPVMFVWPIVIVVGLVMFTIMSKISSDADVAKEREHMECVKSGACTDSGFWLKMGGIAVFAWIAWDKLGVKKAFKK